MLVELAVQCGGVDLHVRVVAEHAPHALGCSHQADEADEADLQPPRSFPGKLARFLLERGRAFQYSLDAGVVVIPCELIENNGDRILLWSSASTSTFRATTSSSA